MWREEWVQSPVKWFTGGGKLKGYRLWRGKGIRVMQCSRMEPTGKVERQAGYRYGGACYTGFGE